MNVHLDSLLFDLSKWTSVGVEIEGNLLLGLVGGLRGADLDDSHVSRVACSSVPCR
jgi:hypothetical protein